MNGGSEPTEGDASTPRPWTVAAAMEPVPPLAPPPAQPGKGLAALTAPRPGDGDGVPRALISIALLAAAIAAIVILVIVLGH